MVIAFFFFYLALYTSIKTQRSSLHYDMYIVEKLQVLSL